MKKIIFAVVVFFTPWLCCATEIMPLRDIRPGMRGVGLTVFEAYQIEKFDVEIIDIVQNFFPQKDLILVRLLGDRVNHTGVVSGMSGSPIYIDNKVIGALAYSVGIFMKDPIAGVTPIEQMLEILTKESVRNQENSAPAQRTTTHFRDYLFNLSFPKSDLFSRLNFQPGPLSGGIKPIATPLVMTGLVPSLYQKLSKCFEQSNLVLLPGGKIDASDQLQTADLRPGSAIAATMISGDFDISGVGTLTYRDGDKLLAFGHPMFDSGPVNIPLAQAKVITTLSSLLESYKFAVATNIIGNIRQDRSTGIMALIGDIPATIPINVKINSPIMAERRFYFKVINDRSTSTMVPFFLWMTLINALESARLGSGDYALKLKGRIDLENSADIIFNNFYSGGGAGYFDGSGLDMPEAAYDIVMTLGALLVNDFTIPTVKAVDLEFYAQPGHKLAEIVKVFYDKEEVNPGDSLNVLISLRPYQGSIIDLNKLIIVPENIHTNSLIVAVGGSSLITKWENEAGIAKFAPKDFDELVLLLNRRRKNSDIIIQLKMEDQGANIHGHEFPSLPPSIYGVIMDKKNYESYAPVKEKILKEWRIPMDFDVRGGKQFSLKIKQ